MQASFLLVKLPEKRVKTCSLTASQSPKTHSRPELAMQGTRLDDVDANAAGAAWRKPSATSANKTANRGWTSDRTEMTEKTTARDGARQLPHAIAQRLPRTATLQAADSMVDGTSSQEVDARPIRGLDPNGRMTT